MPDHDSTVAIDDYTIVRPHEDLIILRHSTNTPGTPSAANTGASGSPGCAWPPTTTASRSGEPNMPRPNLFRTGTAIGENEPMTDTIVLYHRTSAAAARKIRATGRFRSLENTGEIWCSTHSDKNARNYGPVVIALRIPAVWVENDTARLDDGTWESHYAIPASLLKPECIIGITED